jgi:hypothetical protein
MIALAHAEKSAERHHGIFDMAGEFVDHQVVDGTEVVTSAVVNGGSVDFLG